MKICPFCNKKMNDRSEYCRICGSKLNGEDLGDYSTEIINMFKDNEGYYYLFSVNGSQVILRDNLKEKLKIKVLNRNYPWNENKDYIKNDYMVKSTHHTPFKTEEKETMENKNIMDSIHQTPVETEIKVKSDVNNSKHLVKASKKEKSKLSIYGSGPSAFGLGIDNSERALNLRRSIMSKYV